MLIDWTLKLEAVRSFVHLNILETFLWTYPVINIGLNSLLLFAIDKLLSCFATGPCVYNFMFYCIFLSFLLFPGLRSIWFCANWLSSLLTELTNRSIQKLLFKKKINNFNLINLLSTVFILFELLTYPYRSLPCPFLCKAVRPSSKGRNKTLIRRWDRRTLFYKNIVNKEKRDFSPFLFLH